MDKEQGMILAKLRFERVKELLEISPGQSREVYCRVK